MHASGCRRRRRRGGSSRSRRRRRARRSCKKLWRSWPPRSRTRPGGRTGKADGLRARCAKGAQPLLLLKQCGLHSGARLAADETACGKVYKPISTPSSSALSVELSALEVKLLVLALATALTVC